jgi:hypothetical protein
VIRRVVGVLAALTALPLLATPAAPAQAGGGETSAQEYRRESVTQHNNGVTRAPEASRSKVEDQDPLHVTITDLTPSVIPRKGPILVTGTITNVSEETWSLINLYAVVSYTPITNARDLELNAETDPAQQFGNRIIETDPATFDLIDELKAGASASYSVKVPHDVLMSNIAQPTSPGVYWIGIQALGQTVEGRDEPADGRARSFIPYLPKTPDPVRAALVVPIRHEVVYARNGRLRGMRIWTKDLAPGGRLRNLLDFATGAPPGAITWLIDPAVLDAVRRIADRNPPRDLGPVSVGTQPSETPTQSPSDGTAIGSDGKVAVARDNATRWAGEWLDRVTALAGGGAVLGLPYADVDMAAANDLDPQVGVRALGLSASSFQDFGIVADPTVAPPSGYLNAGSVAALDQNVTILASNAVLAKQAGARADNPTTVNVNEHQVSLYDGEASQGGPGPTNPFAPLAVRQRLISEAALRSMSGSSEPLVVAMPFDWNPGTSQVGFFGGLDVAWLSLVPHQSLAQLDPPHVAADDLIYPPRQANRELDGANFAAADRLFRAGATLQNVLVQNSTVEREVAAQALTTTSYFMRADPTQAALDAEAARGSIERSFRQIRISAPPYVTLSSASGRFRVDLTNDLPEPVTVRIEAVVDAELEIQRPAPVRLEGNSTKSVLLHVQSTRLGMHAVKLVVTDEDGTQLGPSANLPIRSSQTGRVIWVIIGAGLALLFGAIALRLYRRITGKKAG